MAHSGSPDDVECRLKAREKETLETLERLEESTMPPAMDGSIGRLSRIDEHQHQQMALHGQRRLQIQLETIRGALQRLRAGTYGRCANCDRPIPAARLEAIPEAPFCAPCQSDLDKGARP